jgi:hypothetical protein
MQQLLADIHGITERLKHIDAVQAKALKRQCVAFIKEQEQVLFLARTNTTIGCFILLPTELTLHICGYTPPWEFFAFSATCRTLREICWSEAAEPVWRAMCDDLPGAVGLNKLIMPKPAHKSYMWYFLVHRVVDKSNRVPLISPCTFGEYAGDFVDGRRCGYGALTSGRRKFTGEFLDDEPHGRGAFDDGDPYSGEFVHGLYHGQGVLYDDGRYEGKFYYGLFISGKWTRWDASTSERWYYKGEHSHISEFKGKNNAGDTISGTMVDGKLHGEYTTESPSGSSITGIACRGNMRLFTYKLCNGDTFTCSSTYEDEPHGKCKYTYADGSVDIGSWHNGKKSGVIFHYDSAGRRTIQEWKAGERIK